MSKIKGIFPLFLATTFGVINGVWVFGPAFKEQQLEKDGKAGNKLEGIPGVQAQESKLGAIDVAKQGSSNQKPRLPNGPQADGTLAEVPVINETPKTWWSTLWADDRRQRGDRKISPQDLMPDEQSEENHKRT